MRIDAEFRRIPVFRCAACQGNLYKDITALLEGMQARGYDEGYPVLAAETMPDGGEYSLLEGHHRTYCAVRCRILTIPAWVVPFAECQKLLAPFCGFIPRKFSRLYPHIFIRGVSYDKLRCDDGRPFYEGGGQYVCRCSTIASPCGV